MGTFSKKIIGIDSGELIKSLNKAFADEWLAYYQYWIGSKVIAGPMRTAVEIELNEHAADELRHAQMLADRIIQLGGTPLLDPQDWQKHTTCGYSAPTDSYVQRILEQNIKGEQCAINAYNKILDVVHNKDYATYNIIQTILLDEIEHEQDLENILHDLEIMKTKFK